MARADADAELSRAITRLLLDEPFYGHLLAQIPRHLGTEVPTAGVGLVGGQLRLLVNPDFFVGRVRRVGERVAVVKHEVLHVVLRHVFRARGRDAVLWNVACDVVVNAWVRPWPLPDGAVTRATFPDLALPADPTADEVYDALRAHAEAAATAWALGPSCHERWGEDPVESEVASASLERLVRQTRARCGGFGGLPGTLAGSLESWLEARSPTVDWRHVVRGFAGQARRSAIVDTLKRPSRRFGTLPGHRVRRRAALLVAVDSSGSVSEESLARFFGEVHGLWRAGADVTVVVCDAEVRSVEPYRGKVPARVEGRGGTAFEPVFAWARAQWPRRFDGLLYLTDGEGPAPTTRPGCPVLWVVEGDGGRHLTGRRIQLR